MAIDANLGVQGLPQSVTGQATLLTGVEISTWHHADWHLLAYGFDPGNPSLAELFGKAFAYDMVYGENSRPYLEYATAQGASATSDGLGMLVEQAAEAFVLWFGIRPDTAPVLALLRNRG